MLFQFMVFVTILSNICIAVEVHKCGPSKKDPEAISEEFSGFAMEYKVGKGDNDWANACEDNNECWIKKGAPIRFAVDFKPNFNESVADLEIKFQLIVNEESVETTFPLEDRDVMKFITLDNKPVQELETKSIYRLKYDIWFGLLTPSSPFNMTLDLECDPGRMACGVIRGYFVD